MANLQQGSVGPAVRELQTRLNTLNVAQPPLAVDGIFGPKTRAAVVSFQSRTPPLKADGIAPLWDALAAQRDARQASGAWAAKRRDQALAWMWERIQAGLRHAFVHHPGIAERLAAATAEVRDGRTPASTAARQLLAAFQLRSPP